MFIAGPKCTISWKSEACLCARLGTLRVDPHAAAVVPDLAHVTHEHEAAPVPASTADAIAAFALLCVKESVKRAMKRCIRAAKEPILLKETRRGMDALGDVRLRSGHDVPVSLPVPSDAAGTAYRTTACCG